MNFKNILKFAIDGIIIRKKTCIFAIIMLVTSMIMINLTFLQINSAYYIKFKIEDAIDKGTSTVIYSYCDDYVEDNYIEFLKDVISEEKIKSYGFYKYDNNVFNELQNNREILEINKKNIHNMSEEDDNSVKVLYLDDTLVNICSIYDIKGNKIKHKSKEKYIPIYVGYNYRNAIDVGSIITSKTLVKKNQKFVYEEIQFKVQGILEKNSFWLEDMTLEAMGNSVDLDSLFVTFKEYDINQGKDRCFFEVKNKDEVENTIDSINNIATSNNINLKISTVDNEVNRNLKNEIENLKIYIILGFFITFMATLSNSAMSTVAILLRKKDFGVMYFNGISRRDVRWIVLCENMIKIVVSIIIALTYVYFSIILNYGGHNPAKLDVLTYIQTRLTVYEIIGIGSFILILSSMVPLLIIRKLNVAELIGGND